MMTISSARLAVWVFAAAMTAAAIFLVAGPGAGPTPAQAQPRVVAAPSAVEKAKFFAEEKVLAIAPKNPELAARISELIKLGRFEEAAALAAAFEKDTAAREADAARDAALQIERADRAAAARDATAREAAVRLVAAEVGTPVPVVATPKAKSVPTAKAVPTATAPPKDVGPAPVSTTPGVFVPKPKGADETLDEDATAVSGATGNETVVTIKGDRLVGSIVGAMRAANFGSRPRSLRARSASSSPPSTASV